MALARFFLVKYLSVRLFFTIGAFDRVGKIFYSVNMWGKVCQGACISQKRLIRQKNHQGADILFGGVHELSIDGKGRLAIPAKFRELLLRRYTPAIVVTLDSRSRLLMYPESVWEKVAEQLLALPVAGKPLLQRYQNLLLHNADTLELDAAGRVLLPANLRKRVDFDKEVTLVGRANRLELWGREHWEAEMDQALDVDAEDLEMELAQTDLQL